MIHYKQAFNAGEISRKIDGRSDLKAYETGCRELDNFYVLFGGGVERRSGTSFIAKTRGTASSGSSNGDKKVKLIPFDFSAATNFIIEIGVGYVRVYNSDGSQVSDSSISGITLPYLETELDKIQFIRRFDTLILTHPNHEPIKIVRDTIAPTFVVSEVEYIYPPLLEPNITSTTITPSATTGSITLTASASLFQSGHVNSIWAIDQIRTSGQRTVTHSSSATGQTNTAELDVSFSNFSVTTSGTWKGSVILQRDINDGNGFIDFVVLGNTSGGTSANFAFNSSVAQDGNTQIRVQHDLDNSGGGTIEVTMTTDSLSQKGLVKITGFTSATEVNATVVSDLGSTNATTNWSEAAFSDYRGFPVAAEFYQNRLFFTGSEFEPATVFGSVFNDIFNFLIGTTSDMAIKRTVDTPEEAKYLIAKGDLFMGTDGGTVSINSVDKDSLVTANNINTQIQNSYGSGEIQAVVANDVVVYVQRNNLKLRALVYSREANVFLGDDLNLLSEDITGTGVKEIFVQKNPEQIIWCIKDDGTACILTYDRQQALTGWANITTTGTIISGATIPATGEDLVYLCVNRGTTDSPIYCIEKFENRLDKTWYVDSGVKATGSNITSVSGLNHLEGKTVQVVADGNFHSEQTVSSGAISIDKKSSTIIAGLKFTSTLVPMPIEPAIRNAETQGKVKSVSKAIVRFLNTKGASVGEKGRQLTNFPVLNTTDPAGQTLTLKTGQQRFFIGSDYEREKLLEIKQDLPYPMTVLSTAIDIEIGGA
jgi:hypothetical protein